MGDDNDGVEKALGTLLDGVAEVTVAQKALGALAVAVGNEFRRAIRSLRSRRR